MHSGMFLIVPVIDQVKKWYSTLGVFNNPELISFPNIQIEFILYLKWININAELDGLWDLDT